MRLTVIGLLGLGLFAAICAAVLVAVLRAERPIAMGDESAIPEVEVVVAARQMPAMTVIDSASVEMKSIPANEVPAGSIRAATSVVGRVLVQPMVEGQAFTSSAFARDGSGVQLASVLAEGRRAMSIALQDFSGLDGLLYPGSMVDVIASFRMAQEDDDGSIRGGDLISTVLLEAIQVLAIENQTIVSGEPKEDAAQEQVRTGRGRRMITLLVDPRQAEALQLASGHGTIALALRNPLDTAPVDRRGTSFVDLSPILGSRLIELDAAAKAEKLAEASPPPPPPEEVVEEPKGPPPWSTIVIRGAQTETQTFEIVDRETEEASQLTRRSQQGPPPPPR